jgi:hypothetical protein
MGRRGQGDYVRWLKGNPGHKKLNLTPPLPTRAELMAIAGVDSPLGFLERARFGGDPVTSARTAKGPSAQSVAPPRSRAGRRRSSRQKA